MGLKKLHIEGEGRRIMPTLKELRRLSYLSQEALAEKAGVARETINKYESGLERPGKLYLLALAKALRVDPEQIQFPDRQKSISLHAEKKSTLAKSQIELFLCVLNNGILDRLQGVPTRTIRKYFGETKLSDYIIKVRSEHRLDGSQDQSLRRAKRILRKIDISEIV
jgi:transcriptional regulator with XRE-family HTH domain